MKKSLLFFLLNIFIFSASLDCQIQSWPPGGIQISSKFKLPLPDSRFVPSSKRWNMVWADQLVPAWITPGKVEFAAKNYVGTQKLFADQISQYRSFNSNFLCLIYRLSSGLNPAENRHCPDPKTNSGTGYIGVVSPLGYVSEYLEYFVPWVNSQQLSGDAYESMFQHYDVKDSLHRVWHQDPYWLMDVSNSNWREYIVSTSLIWMDEMTCDGCFYDVSVEWNCSLYNPKSGNPEPGNFNWWEYPHKPATYPEDMTDRSVYAKWQNGMYLQYFQALYSYFHESGSVYLLIPNIDQMITTVYDPTWLEGNMLGQTVDGAMMENFGSCSGQDMYLSLERGFRYLTSKNKILIAQCPASTPEERLRRTAMYMLIKNENSFINLINSGRVEWYPEYEIDLGNIKPLPDTFEELREKGSGYKSLWKRQYDSGYVVCNTSDDTISYNPYADGWAYLKTSGGGEVGDDGTIKQQSLVYTPFKGSIPIPPSQCMVFKHVDSLPNSVEYAFDAPDFSINPNPVTSNANLLLNLNESKQLGVRITDMMGTTVKHLPQSYFETGKHTLNIDLNELLPGMYFCEISGDRYFRKTKFIKL